MCHSTAECPVCKQQKYFSEIEGPLDKPYLLCEQCQLIFLDPGYFPEPSEEKAHYLTHKNGIQYRGYVRFLRQALDPTLPFLSDGDRGLDYGCGPVPTLSILAERAGYPCKDYDPLFFPELPVGPHDFIFATECFEHFFDPPKEMVKIRTLLSDNGILTIMTHCWESIPRFKTWKYARDPTHVCFYHMETLQYLSKQYGFEWLATDHKRVVVLRKALDQ